MNFNIIISPKCRTIYNFNTLILTLINECVQNLELQVIYNINVFLRYTNCTSMKNSCPGYFTIRINIALQISCQTILAIVMFVFLRYTDSDYPFGIFQLFQHQHSCRPGHLKQPSPVNCVKNRSPHICSPVVLNEMSFLITWQVLKQQVNKYQSFATMEPYLTNPGKNWTGHQKTRWSPRESKIDLRLS